MHLLFLILPFLGSPVQGLPQDCLTLLEGAFDACNLPLLYHSFSSSKYDTCVRHVSSINNCLRDEPGTEFDVDQKEWLQILTTELDRLAPEFVKTSARKSGSSAAVKSSTRKVPVVSSIFRTPVPRPITTVQSESNTGSVVPPQPTSAPITRSADPPPPSSTGNGNNNDSPETKKNPSPTPRSETARDEGSGIGTSPVTIAIVVGVLMGVVVLPMVVYGGYVYTKSRSPV